MKEHLVISNQVEELSVLAGKLEEIAEKWKFPLPLTMNINLVLEEAVSNILFYAFPDGEKHDINIVLSLNDDELTIVIEDDGKPFNPTTIEQPDIHLPADERPIGGLGIFLISKIMDTVLYNRNNNKNTLTLKKKIAL